ncbi:Inter alpha-trypsin inhibitor heavy chain 4 [Nymphaea thermarum]|nr:Inter alpha-trypsin inhibitor heavy chain 4 [Nymphaea thermarum]
MYVSSDDVFGGLLVQSPHPDDFDKRDIFCLYILPASKLHVKVFRREVIFLIDTSASIQGMPLEESKNAISAALMNLRPTDSFSIMSFNEEIFSFSSSLVPATEEKMEEAHQWLRTCHATGGTSILLPLNENKAMARIRGFNDRAVQGERLEGFSTKLTGSLQGTSEVAI